MALGVPEKGRDRERTRSMASGRGPSPHVEAASPVDAAVRQHSPAALGVQANKESRNDDDGVGDDDEDDMDDDDSDDEEA